MSTPQAVTFDCWNTLLREASWESAHGLRVDALVRAGRHAGREVTRVDAARAFDAGWERHMTLWEQGVASGAVEVAHWALAELDIFPGGEAVEVLVRDFQEASHSGLVMALDGAVEALDALAGADVRMALICDTGLTPGRVVRQHLDRLGLLRHLGATIFSDEWSLPKPHPRVFRAALTALGCEAQRCVHVGDLKRTDVAGARAVGMTTVRIRAQHDDASAHAEADHVVDSHAELLRVLGLGGDAA